MKVEWIKMMIKHKYINFHNFLFDRLYVLVLRYIHTLCIHIIYMLGKLQSLAENLFLQFKFLSCNYVCKHKWNNLFYSVQISSFIYADDDSLFYFKSYVLWMGEKKDPRSFMKQDPEKSFFIQVCMLRMFRKDSTTRCVCECVCFLV